MSLAGQKRDAAPRRVARSAGPHPRSCPTITPDAGIEHQHTSEVAQCIKLISVPGTARVCKFAMDYAEQHGRKKVTCVTKVRQRPLSFASAVQSE